MSHANTKQDLPELSYDQITPDILKNLQEPTEKFLCKFSENWPHIRFVGFKSRDIETGHTLVKVKDDEVDNSESGTLIDQGYSSTHVTNYS